MTRYAAASRYGRGFKHHRLLTISFYIDPREVRIVTVSLARFWLVVSGVVAAVISGVTVLLYTMGVEPGEPVASPVASMISEVKAVTDSKGLVGPLPSLPAAARVEASFGGEGNIEPVDGLAEAVSAVKYADNGNVTKDAVPILTREKTKFCKVAFDQNWVISDNGAVIIGLTIENLESRAITGRVWGVASYDEFAEKFYVGSTSAIEVMQPDDSSNRIFGQAYSARKATRKVFEFNVPPGRVIDEVTIFVDEGPGGEKIFYDSMKR